MNLASLVTHFTSLLWAFFAGRCHVLLLLAVLQSVMGILVFSGPLLWFLSLLWACLSCYGILVCRGLSCGCDAILSCGYSVLRWLPTWVLLCFYGMFCHLLVLQWCSLLQGRLLFQQNLEWVILKIESWGVWQVFYQLCWCRTESLQQLQPIFMHTSPGRHGLSSTVPLICLQTLWCLLFILCLLCSSPVQGSK